MAKVKTETMPFPLPICIVGTMVKGKANYATYGSFRLLSPRPKNYVYIGSQAARYTNIGIKENGYFSVNIPSVEQMQKTDYVGIVSGARVDKSAVFNSFFGSSDRAPMIEECPVNMVCKLVKTADLPNRDIFFGEVLDAYVNEKCMVDGILDFTKINPPAIHDVRARQCFVPEAGECCRHCIQRGKSPDKNPINVVVKGVPMTELGDLLNL